MTMTEAGWWRLVEINLANIHSMVDKVYFPKSAAKINLEVNTYFNNKKFDFLHDILDALHEDGPFISEDSPGWDALDQLVDEYPKIFGDRDTVFGDDHEARKESS